MFLLRCLQYHCISVSLSYIRRHPPALIFLTHMSSSIVCFSFYHLTPSPTPITYHLSTITNHPSSLFFSWFGYLHSSAGVNVCPLVFYPSLCSILLWSLPDFFCPTFYSQTISVRPYFFLITLQPEFKPRLSFYSHLYWSGQPINLFFMFFPIWTRWNDSKINVSGSKTLTWRLDLTWIDIEHLWLSTSVECCRVAVEWRSASGHDYRIRRQLSGSKLV